ncbi:FHA domain-containing protein [Phocaeicola barnesiae]|uniref:FHA domain-containing protein n=1 Tax=Phocaeicola barnesiae TaxID=376804 RepID=UPI0025A3A9FE|nr:FHA domain-containing protein [Phocaeicola barnesiae]MDM8240760.1 FHA domain-containing protein [Phocaeicola barnesiae]
MKLIKIGSSSSCDIVLHSEFVSSHHAEMILLDNGEIILEDKNSTNGTFVGNKKISPNKEVTVRRGDYIRFADVELQWAHVPVIENAGKYKAIVNIGTNFRNEIVITGNYPSRFHATMKITKDGKAFLTDSGSKNGTKVNGVKLQPGKDVRIKRGDIVICGDVDVTEQLKPYLPVPFPWIKTLAAVVVAAALVGVVALIFVPKEPCIICGEKGCKGHPAQDFRPAVVYVRACYHYVITFEDNPMPEYWDGKFILRNDADQKVAIPYQATAFFIDREGRLATNRHVAVPWEYRSKQDENVIRSAVEKWLESFTYENFEKNSELAFAQTIYNYALATTPNLTLERFHKTRSKLISRLNKSKYTISGEMDYITVGYPGRYYTHTDEFDRCSVVSESGTDDKDIAILQMNDKKTPDNIKYIFEVKNFYTDKLEPLKDKLYTIGYPNGVVWAMDSKMQSLEPAIRETMCSKMPSKYTFDFQGESVGGASGSPIFNEKGQLVGVLWGRRPEGITFGRACQAKYLKEMYNEELGYE